MTPKRKYLPFIPLFDGGVWTIKERIMVYVYIIMSHPMPTPYFMYMCIQRREILLMKGLFPFSKIIPYMIINLN